MEPQSAFYKGPLLVMDFQSLYPSVMIAYNYCYSQVSSFVDPRTSDRVLTDDLQNLSRPSQHLQGVEQVWRQRD